MVAQLKLDITYETILTLFEQLPDDQKRDLMQRLQLRIEPETLPPADKMARLRAAQIYTSVNEEPSIRREDWYDDDGR